MTDAIAEYAARQALERTRKTSKRRRTGFSRDARALKIDGKPCRMCIDEAVMGSVIGWSVEYHHIVPRAHFSKTDDDVKQSANAMPLCHLHHQNHHNNPDRRVPRYLLEVDEIEFAQTRMGAGWVDRWYPNEEVAS